MTRFNITFTETQPLDISFVTETPGFDVGFGIVTERDATFHQRFGVRLGKFNVEQSRSRQPLVKRNAFRKPKNKSIRKKFKGIFVLHLCADACYCRSIKEGKWYGIF